MWQSAIGLEFTHEEEQFSLYIYITGEYKYINKIR